MKICELCGVRSARYVCQECGRSVCERCIKSYSWLCLECHRKIISPSIETEEETIFSIPFIRMFFLGFILMFAGIIILFLASLLSGLKIPSGGIIIWLIPLPPIIFGAGEHLLPLLTLGIALIVIIFLAAFFLLAKRKIRLEHTQ